MPRDDLARFCCQNAECQLYGRRDAGNLLVIDRFAKGRYRLLHCRTCEARFSVFKDHPLFNSKLPQGQVLAALEHLTAGCGVRQTARLVGVNEDTVTRLAVLAGEHARAAHDELVPFPALGPRGPAR